MPGIVESPKPVQDAPAQYGDPFANECQRRHRAEYLTGLIVAGREAAPAIGGEFAPRHRPAPPQPLPHRRRSGRPRPHRRRPEDLREDPSTRYRGRGAIPIDNTLIDRGGLLIPDAGWLPGTAPRSGTGSPRATGSSTTSAPPASTTPPEFRPSRGREICEALGEPVRDHTASRCEPIGWVCARTVPGDSTMDCYFTGTEVRNPIHGKEDRFGRPRGTWAA